MKLPVLSPGKRVTVTRPAGSGDALILTHLSQQNKAEHRLTAVVCADALDASRLVEEIPFFDPTLRVVRFPDWETLPYDRLSPHQDLISERLATLWAILQGQADVVMIASSTMLYRLAPPSFLAGHTFVFKRGQKLDEASILGQLTLGGYNHVTQVVSPGEYAVRGGLIDLFPMGSPVPYRIDLFDNEIDTIRSFDPDTQRTILAVTEIRLLPGREFPLDTQDRTSFRQRWRELIEGDPTKSRLYRDMAAGVPTAGVEYYLPLFFDRCASVFDYLIAGFQNPHLPAALVLHGEIETAMTRFAQDLRERYRMAQGDPEWPVLAPEKMFLTAEDFYVAARNHPQLAIRETTSQNQQLSIAIEKIPPISAVRGSDRPLAQFQAHMDSSNRRTLILAQSNGRRESLLDFLRNCGIHPPTFESLDQFLAQAPEPLGIEVQVVSC